MCFLDTRNFPIWPNRTKFEVLRTKRMLSVRGRYIWFKINTEKYKRYQFVFDQSMKF